MKKRSGGERSVAMRIRSRALVQLAIAVACVAVAFAAAADEAAPGLRADQHLGPEPKAEVQRVVTLAPSLTDLVLALGAGSKLVGVTRFDDDPRVAALPRIGGYNDPEPEAVLHLSPDLVLAQPAPANRGPVEALARLGVPVDAFKLGTLQEIDEALAVVGARLGASSKADELVRGLHEHRREVRARAPAKGVRALLVFGLDPLVVAGRSGFAGELLEETGAVNAVDDARPFVRFSAEAAVASHPDRIILCGVDSPVGNALPGLAAIPLSSLRSTALLHPGPRLSEALDDLVFALSPAAGKISDDAPGRAQSGSPRSDALDGGAR